MKQPEHTPAEITSVWAVNFKELKRRLQESVTDTLLQGDMCVCVCCTQTPLWPFHTWLETPVISSLPANTLSHFMLLSCCLPLVTDVSPHWRQPRPLYVKMADWRKCSTRLCRDVCDSSVIISESWSAQTDEARKCDWMRDCRRRLLMEMWKVSSANHIKS